MYKNYIFDLYGTLIDINTDESIDILWEKIALFFGYNGANYTADEFRDTYFKLINDAENGLKDKNELTKNRVNYVHEAYPEIQLEFVFKKMYQLKGVDTDIRQCISSGHCFRSLSTNYIKLYDGTIELLEAIKKNDGKIYLLSNAQRIFTEYEMKMLGIYDYFDDIFISSDYLCKKPDVRFFYHLLNRHGLDIKESIMIGNDLTTDIAGAKAIDMDTFFIYSNLSPFMETFDEKQIASTYAIDGMDLIKVRDLLVK